MLNFDDIIQMIHILGFGKFNVFLALAISILVTWWKSCQVKARLTQTAKRLAEINTYLNLIKNTSNPKRDFHHLHKSLNYSKSLSIFIFIQPQTDMTFITTLTVYWAWGYQKIWMINE